MRSILLAGSQSSWLRRQATKRKFMKRAVARFMPGETLEEALLAAERLGERGLATILTHLGENITDRTEAAAEVEHYLKVLERIRRQTLDAEVSIKLTQLGLDLDAGLTAEHAARLAAHAQQLGSRLWIDMEASPYVDPTLALYTRLRRSGADVGVCLQAYLHRTPQDLEALLPLGPAIRLVKGAYREPASLALQRKRDVDERYFELATRLFADDAREAGAWLTVATHDPVLIRRVEALARARGVGSEDFEFAMLYGIQSMEQQRLSSRGFRVRVLISYGTHWFAWYMRRLAERPSNMLLAARSLLGPPPE